MGLTELIAEGLDVSGGYFNVEENNSCYGIVAHIKPFSIKYAANFRKEPMEMNNGCRILLRTRGKGPMVKFYHYKYPERIDYHDNVRTNGGVCLGNLEKPISKLLKAEEYAVALSLLIEFIQVFNGI